MNWLILASSLLSADGDEPPLATITVLGRRPEPLAEVAVTATVLDPGAAEPAAVHPNELFDGVAGTWVSRGSGQEHLTAIRSPVLTGAGACGAFLYLEDGIPIRPAGFCNINNLFEVNLDQARRVEVLKGPSSAPYGANGLHGTINAVTGRVEVEDAATLGLTLGSDDYYRADLSYSSGSEASAWRANLSGVSAGSFRELEGYDQQKVNLRWDTMVGSAEVSSTLAATNLNQETAGFIFGLDAYRDPAARRSNVNPEAFRDAWSVRAASRWSWDLEGTEMSVTPFARSSKMDFLQHFLPGKPLEENGQDSVGVQWLMSREREDWSWQWGLDVDLADGFLRQTQAGPTVGSAFLVETRPAGTHYDYQVDARSVALFGQLSRQWHEDWTLQLGLRAERLSYDYDNRWLTGNTRDDGSSCGFGGCLYNRPADREDSFTELAPKLSVSRRLSDQGIGYLRLARGFRPPQATELYRLQRQQSVADLDSEILDSVELGYRRALGEGRIQLSAYYMSKDNFIFRDSAGFNVSDGQTRHRGVELDWSQVWGRWQADAVVSYARQHYGFTVGAGESIASGNQVDTAPEWLGRASIARELGTGSARLEWVHQGGYALDAANEHFYGGHDLLHLNLDQQFGQWRFNLRLANLANRRYAERADFAFGNYRYFPGSGRSVFLGITWRQP